jgi:hypothetical protein
MKFNDRSMALLGIPDLPPRAFIRKAGGGIIPQGGSGSVPTSTTQTNTGLPAWALPYAQDTLAKQSALSDRGYQPYGEDRIAGFSPLQEQAKTQAAGMQTNQAVGQGMGIAGQVAQGGLNTQNFGQAQADQYMSPYMQNVVDIQKREAQRQSGIQGTQQQAQAAQAGAFGGSRDAIMRAERERNLGTQMGDIQAQGSQAAYTNAQQQFNADQNRGIQGMQLAGSAANTLGQLGGQQFQQGVDINKLQSAYGTQEQALKQAGLSQAYQDFQNQQAFPQQQLGYMANMINGLPIGTESSVYKTGTPGTPSDLQKLSAVGMGLSSFFADGGSVDSQSNIEEIVHKLSDAQLGQAAKAAQARGDQEQLQVIGMEQAARASMKRGLGSLPVDMNRMLPTEESMARGGVVAFADEGYVNEDAPNNSGVYSPGDPVAYKSSMGKATGLLDALQNLSLKPPRTTAERDADMDRYYKKMQDTGGPDVYADYEKLLKEDRASGADDLKESRRMAILSAIPAMLQGNDFATAAGNALGTYAQGRSEGNKANKASQRAAAKELLGLATGRRAEKIAYLKDAQAYSDGIDKALKEGNTAEADRLYKLSQLHFAQARLNKPQRPVGGGAAPKPFDVINKAELAYAQNPTTANRIVVEAARRSAAALKEMGPGALNLKQEAGDLAANVKAADAGDKAVKRLIFDDTYRTATPTQKKQIERATRLEAENGIKRMERSGGTSAPATGGPTVSNWN